MNTPWTHFRRLVTSLMLVAMASFVLHSGALAGMHRHGQSPSDCRPMAASAQGHLHGAEAHVHRAAHDHGDGAVHHHASDDAADESAPDDRQASAEGACCASACPVAMAPLSLAAISAPMGIAVALPATSQDGSGTSLDGLKRPPRTPGIA